MISTVLDYRLFLYSSRYHSLTHPLYNTLIISADISWYLFLILNSAIAVAEIAASSNLYLTLYLFLLIFVQFLIFTCAFEVADIAAWSNLYITLSLYLLIYVGIYRIWFSLVPLQWQISQPDPLFTSNFTDIWWYQQLLILTWAFTVTDITAWTVLLVPVSTVQSTEHQDGLTVGVKRVQKKPLRHR